MWYGYSGTLGSFVPGTNYLPSLPAAKTQALRFLVHSRNGINLISVERWLTKLGSLRFHPSRSLQISSKIPSTKHKAAVADKTMEMRVKVDEISESLDRDHSPWHGFFFIQCLTEELLKTLKGALAELPQKLPIESKIGPDSGHVSLGNAAIF